MGSCTIARSLCVFVLFSLPPWVVENIKIYEYRICRSPGVSLPIFPGRGVGSRAWVGSEVILDFCAMRLRFSITDAPPPGVSSAMDSPVGVLGSQA